jgi:hypothetical protein
LAWPFSKGLPALFVSLIVTSGHRHVRTEELPDRGRFFAKPYNVNALSQALEEMVGG